MSILNSFKIWTLFQYFKDIILNEYIPQLIDGHQQSHQHREAGWLVYREQFLPWCKRYQVQDPDEPFFRNSQEALVVKNPPANAGDWETGFDPWVGETPRRRAQQPASVTLPGEPQGQRSLEGYSPQGHKELGMTEAT